MRVSTKCKGSDIHWTVVLTGNVSVRICGRCYKVIHVTYDSSTGFTYGQGTQTIYVQIIHSREEKQKKQLLLTESHCLRAGVQNKVIGKSLRQYVWISKYLKNLTQNKSSLSLFTRLTLWWALWGYCLGPDTR